MPLASEVLSRPRLRLEERYHVPSDVAVHAQSVALRFLNDSRTKRYLVHSDTPSTQVYEYLNEWYPGWRVRLYRPVGINHCWVVHPPRRKEILLEGKYNLVLDEAEFHDADRRDLEEKRIRWKPKMKDEDVAFIEEVRKLPAPPRNPPQ
jgi:hypothetical protein